MRVLSDKFEWQVTHEHAAKCYQLERILVSKVCRELAALGHDVEESSPQVDWELFVDATIPIWTASMADGALGLAQARGIDVGPDVLEAVTAGSAGKGRQHTARGLAQAAGTCHN